MNSENLSVLKSLLDALWVRYDSGGFSMGRSRVAGLLEAAMNLFFEETTHVDLPQIKETLLKTKPCKQGPLVYKKPKDMPNHQLVYLLIAELKDQTENRNYRDSGPFDIEIEILPLFFSYYEKVSTESTDDLDTLHECLDWRGIILEAEGRWSLNFQKYWEQELLDS